MRRRRTVSSSSAWAVILADKEVMLIRRVQSDYLVILPYHHVDFRLCRGITRDEQYLLELPESQLTIGPSMVEVAAMVRRCSYTTTE